MNMYPNSTEFPATVSDQLPVSSLASGVIRCPRKSRSHTQGAIRHRGKANSCSSRWTKPEN